MGGEPAILETDMEIGFVRKGHRTLRDIRNFWIGGRAENFGTSNYIPELGTPERMAYPPNPYV